MFHYALKPGGYLMPGSSETIRRVSRAVRAGDTHNKALPQETDRGAPAVRFPGSLVEPRSWAAGAAACAKPAPTCQREADRILT